MAIDLSKLGIKPSDTQAQPEQPEQQEQPESAPAPVPEVQPSEPTKPKLALNLAKMMQKQEPAPQKQESESVVLPPATTQAEGTGGHKPPQVPSVPSINAGEPAQQVEDLQVTPSEPMVEPVNNFRQVLDELDQMFVEGQGYSTLVLDEVRNRIVRVSKELKESPELMQFVKDEDLRNIMAFIQQSADSARSSFAEKKTKAVKKQAKSKVAISMDFSGLTDGLTGIDSKESDPLTIEDLSATNFDAVKPLMKRR